MDTDVLTVRAKFVALFRLCSTTVLSQHVDKPTKLNVLFRFAYTK